MNPDNDPYFPNDEHDMMQESALFPWVDDDPYYDLDPNEDITFID
jgi:hypothetical protein